MGNQDSTKCGQCGGFGKIVCAGSPFSFACPFCRGTGSAPSRSLWVSRGGLLRQARLDAGLTLRQAAARFGIDPGYLSRMENGMVNPRSLPFAESGESETP